MVLELHRVNTSAGRLLRHSCESPSVRSFRSAAFCCSVALLQVVGPFFALYILHVTFQADNTACFYAKTP